MPSGRNHTSYKDMTGKTVRGITFLHDTNKRKHGLIVWIAICHCGATFETTSTSVTSGHKKSCGCRTNAQYKIGKDSPLYNHSLTDKERSDQQEHRKLKHPESLRWAKSVYKRDDYTCQKCNQRGGRLNAHHLNAWSWCIEQRFDVDNGVTLCQKCHNQFHKECGRKNNTKEQYEEWIEE
jgi:hypothetical protein